MRLFYWFIFIEFVAFGQSDTLDIVSWNTFLRPAILSDDQMNRVHDIAAFLDSSHCDVLVLQEVFHRKARKELIFQLKAKYPYHTKRGRNSVFGVSSGVLILSKLPIHKTSSISFRKAKGSDALAKKGVVKVVLNVQGVPVEVFGTHLQAGGGDKRKIIRAAQIDQLSEFMNQSKDSVIQIVAGDFNVSRSVPMFDSLITTLDVQFPELVGSRKYTANFHDQNLFETSGDPKWIDFVFLCKHKLSEVVSAEIFEPRMPAESEWVRVSDHNPISLKIVVDTKSP